jgi:hypothetical protein
MRVLFDQISERTIHRTVEGIFRAPEFQRSTLLDRFWFWIRGLLNRFFAWLTPGFHALKQSPMLYWTVVISLGVLVAIAVARVLYLWRVRTARRASGEDWEQQAGAARGDAWAAAQRLAASGNYTAAAHALYAALLDAGARKQQLRLHPSKTAGDYVREVKRRSPAAFPTFRDFARSYELVIYGLGECNRERYERLFSIALPIVRPNG